MKPYSSISVSLQNERLAIFQIILNTHLQFQGINTRKLVLIHFHVKKYSGYMIWNNRTSLLGLLDEICRILLQVSFYIVAEYCDIENKCGPSATLRIPASHPLLWLRRKNNTFQIIMGTQLSPWLKTKQNKCIPIRE